MSEDKAQYHRNKIEYHKKQLERALADEPQTLNKSWLYCRDCDEQTPHKVLSVVCTCCGGLREIK